MFRAGWREEEEEGQKERMRAGGRNVLLMVAPAKGCRKTDKCSVWNGVMGLRPKKCKVIIPLPTLTHAFDTLAFDATFILIIPMKVTSHELS